jgi:Mn-dependent DtxR family transcriptional regulator
MEKEHLGRYESAIMQTLHSKKKHMSTEEISKEVGISWMTTRKWLRRLKDDGMLKRIGREWGL